MSNQRNEIDVNYDYQRWDDDFDLQAKIDAGEIYKDSQGNLMYKDFDEDDTDTSTTMYESQYGTRGPVTFGKWGLCVICNRSEPLTKLTKYKGKLYCRRHIDDAVKEG